MQITRYVASGKETGVIAFFSVKIPQFMDMTINSCRLVKTNSGGKFISLPQEEYMKNGEKKYSPYIWFDKEIMERLQKGLLKVVNEYIEANNPQPTQESDQVQNNENIN